MALSLQEVERIADLARLRLTDEEKARFRDQLSAVLEYAERLQELDTSAIPPTASVLPLRTVLRSDEVVPSLERDRLLQGAPEADTDRGMFRVPPILE